MAGQSTAHPKSLFYFDRKRVQTGANDTGSNKLNFNNSGRQAHLLSLKGLDFR